MFSRNHIRWTCERMKRWQPYSNGTFGGHARNTCLMPRRISRSSLPTRKEIDRIDRGSLIQCDPIIQETYSPHDHDPSIPRRRGGKECLEISIGLTPSQFGPIAISMEHDHSIVPILPKPPEVIVTAALQPSPHPLSLPATT